MYKFSLTINDKKKTLKPRHGLDISELGPLIDDLKKAIGDDSERCTLSKITNHGYTPNFETESEKQFNNFIEVHRNIYEKPLEELRTKERKYAQTLKSVLHNNRTIQAYAEKKPIVKISSKEIDRIVETYQVVTEIFGVVAEMGSPGIKKRTHVFVDGYDFKIYTTHEQDNDLKKYYRQLPITFKVRQKRSIQSDKVISAMLLTFSPKTEGKLVRNIEGLGSDDLSFLNSINTPHDIINLLRS